LHAHSAQKHRGSSIIGGSVAAASARSSLARRQLSAAREIWRGMA